MSTGGFDGRDVSPCIMQEGSFIYDVRLGGEEGVPEKQTKKGRFRENGDKGEQKFEYHKMLQTS